MSSPYPWRIKHYEVSGVEGGEPRVCPTFEDAQRHLIIQAGALLQSESWYVHAADRPLFGNEPTTNTQMRRIVIRHVDGRQQAFFIRTVRDE